MYSKGTLTAITYAGRISSLPADLLFMPIATVLAPFFSDHHAKKEKDLILNKYIDTVRFLWFLLIPISTILICYSHEFIEILYQRGNFSKESTMICSNALRCYAVSIFGLAFVAVNSRLLISMGKTFVPSISAVFISGVSILITQACSNKFGYIGIPLSRTISVIGLSMIIGLFLSKKYLIGFKTNKLIVPLAIMISASFLSFLLNVAIFQFLDKLIIWNNILKLIIESSLLIIGYLFACFIFKIKETGIVLENAIKVVPIKFG